MKQLAPPAQKSARGAFSSILNFGKTELTYQIRAGRDDFSNLYSKGSTGLSDPP